MIATTLTLPNSLISKENIERLLSENAEHGTLPTTDDDRLFTSYALAPLNTRARLTRHLQERRNRFFSRRVFEAVKEC